MITLHTVDLSGNGMKVRLLLSLLGLDYETKKPDMMKGEHKSPEFLKLNPLGQVPVLVDGAVTLRDSQAILVYLARKYGGDKWLPGDAAQMGEVMQWLFFAGNEIYQGPNRLRLANLLKLKVDVELARKITEGALKVMEAQLARHDWLALDRLTIADLACYPYTALAYQGDFDLAPYESVRAWIARIEALPRYVGMPGLPKAA
ncbi:MAG TPA: glutathione S-transferase [Alphaproteobacteria bacterium]|jgi:glutathione S-transferase|nr:glutathione S-transferase [Alphaproteobacteria bacterium]